VGVAVADHLALAGVVGGSSALPGYQKLEPVGKAHRRDTGGALALPVERDGTGGFTATLDGPGGRHATVATLRSGAIVPAWAKWDIGEAATTWRPRRRPAPLIRGAGRGHKRPRRPPTRD
jgi:hypothetical protein